MKAVVKVGGSLQGSPSLKDICEILGKVSGRHNLIVVPGGGKFADLVRVMQAHLELSDRTSHLMAIMGMDVYGLALNELISELQLTDSLKRARRGAAIFLPFKTVTSDSDLEPSWRVTSDSLAAWTCAKAGYKELILIKRVDGVYDEKLISSVSTRELGRMDQSIVDSKLPDILEDYGITCRIVNGEFPDRVEEVIETGKGEGTKIYPEGKS